MTDRIPTSDHAPESDSETPIRLLVLGAVYAGAMFFAIAFSPAIGFVTPVPVGDSGKIASIDQRSALNQ